MHNLTEGCSKATVSETGKKLKQQRHRSRSVDWVDAQALASISRGPEMFAHPFLLIKQLHVKKLDSDSCQILHVFGLMLHCCLTGCLFWFRFAVTQSGKHSDWTEFPELWYHFWSPQWTGRVPLATVQCCKKSQLQVMAGYLDVPRS